MEMVIYPKKLNQHGLAPILLIILISVILGASILAIKNIPFKQPSLTVTPTEGESTDSAGVNTGPSPDDPKDSKLITPTKINPTLTKTTSQTPKVSDKIVILTPTITPTPPTKTITISGFAYEDRTNDGLFNSDDPKLRYMQFFIYDSYTNQQISTIYSEQNGQFTTTNTVRGNLTIKPTCNDNFCPKDGLREFSSSSSDQQFAFRSASAPTSNNNGVIEGDLIITGDRAYKFYLLDKNDNSFTNIEWAGGHFKIQNLPNNQTYIIRISYGDSSPDNTEVVLTPSSPEVKTLQIQIKK